MKERTHESLPTRRRGGQEPPDDVQDRPEQNKGYDAAVRGDSTATPQSTLEEAEAISLGRVRAMPISRSILRTSQRPKTRAVLTSARQNLHESRADWPELGP